MKRKPFLLLTGLRFSMGFAFASAPLTSQADILYWDTNGATPGSTSNSSGGGQNGWGPHNVWSTSEAGDVATIGYTEDSDVVFSAGTNANSTSTTVIRINGAHRANSLTFEEGTITLSSGNANGDFVSGGGSLSLGAGGITITDTVNGITTIAGGLGTLTLTANQTWNNLSVTTPQVLRVETAVAGTATAGNTTTLTLSGTGPSTVANLLVGSITNGSGGGELALTKSGSSVYSFVDSAANTYTGITTVTGGLLLLNKTAGVTSIAGNISVTGGTIEWRQNNQIADTSVITATGGRISFLNRAETLDTINLSGGALETGNQGTSNQINVTNVFNQSGGKTTINSGGNLSVGSFIMTGTRNVINGTGGGNILIGGNYADAKSTLRIGSGGLSMSGQDIQFNLATGSGIGSRIVLDGNFTGTGVNNIGYGTGEGAKLSNLELGTADRTFDITGTTTIGVSVQGTGSKLTKTGSGILAFSDANTYTGVTEVNAGSLHVLHSSALGGSAAGTVVASGASITLNNNVSVAGETLHLTGASFDAPQNAGIVNAGGDNVWTGNITANNSNGQQVRINNAAGTLDIRGNVFIDSASGATGIGLVLTGAGGTGTVSGNISGTGNNQNLIKTGNGTWVLSGANSYTGVTRVDAGIVSVGSVATNLGSASSAINLGDGSGTGRLRYTGGGETVTRGFVLRADSSGGGVIEQAGTGLLKINGNISSNSSTSAKTITLTGSTAGTGEVAGNILNSANSATNLAKSGSGTWRLSGAGNTFTGSTTVTEGTLIAAASLNTSTSLSVANGTFSYEMGNVISDTAHVTLGEEAVLQFNGFSDALGVLAVTGNAELALSGGNSVITFADSTSGDWSGGNLTISGWSGLASGGGTERVSFTNQGLNSNQRNAIHFSNPEGFAPGLYSAVFVGNELVPGELIPEPSAILLSGAALASFALRRKRTA
jgi:fibronectin-binding autotransporter adhesin